jgi:acetyl-CoA synthetase
MHSSVAESAVIGYPHKVYGDGICAFVILKNENKLSDEALIDELKILVKRKIASYAAPHIIIVSMIAQIENIY